MSNENDDIKFCDKCGRPVEDHENLGNLFIHISVLAGITAFSSPDRHIACSPSRAQHILHRKFPKIVDERPEYDRRKMSRDKRKRLDKRFTKAWVSLQIYYKKMKPSYWSRFTQWLNSFSRFCRFK